LAAFYSRVLKWSLGYTANENVPFGAALTEQKAEIDVLLNKIANDHPDDVNKDHTRCKRRRYQTNHYDSAHHFCVTNAK